MGISPQPDLSAKLTQELLRWHYENMPPMPLSAIDVQRQLDYNPAEFER
jgi:hypothetical protein